MIFWYLLGVVTLPAILIVWMAVGAVLSKDTGSRCRKPNCFHSYEIGSKTRAYIYLSRKWHQATKKFNPAHKEEK